MDYLILALTLLVIIITIGLIGCVIYSKLDSRFVLVGRIGKIIIYPIKSLPGIELNHAILTSQGLKYGHFEDRSFILTYGNKMITQRSEPTLALLKVEITEPDVLTVSSSDGSQVDVKLFDYAQEPQINFKVWSDRTNGVECDKKVSKWFEKYLNRPGVKLMQHVPSSTFRASTCIRNGKLEKDGKSRIRYQDSSPCMIINTQSIEDLNSRLTEGSVSYRNFRPSLLVASEPYWEDDWSCLKINDILFTRLYNCLRCKLTTVDPDKGTFSKSSEPLKTLREYRVAKNSYEKSLYGMVPSFGVHFRPESETSVHVNQDVYAILGYKSNYRLWHHEKSWWKC